MTAERVTLAIEGMHCASCGLLIDEVLEDLAGVVRSTTRLRKRRTVVDFDARAVNREALIAAIAEAGYRAVVSD